MRRTITGFSNPTVKFLRSLREKKHRKAEQCFLAEGLRLLTDARESGRLPQMLVMSKDPAYELNPALVARALALTKDVALVDTPDMQAYRATYVGMPNAQKPPFVLLGDSFGSSRYWHGPTMTLWANDWSKLWTKSTANFVMTNMEDQGIAAALSLLTKMGKADFQRVLFLRTGSNYCTPAPKQGVVQSMQAEYAGWVPSVESAYRVGSVVVHDIVAQWDALYAKGVTGK